MSKFDSWVAYTLISIMLVMVLAEVGGDGGAGSLACTGSLPVAGTNFSIGAITLCNYNITTLGAFNITGITNGLSLTYNNSNLTTEALKPAQNSNWTFINSTLSQNAIAKGLQYYSPSGIQYGFFNSTTIGLKNGLSTFIDNGESFYAEYTVFSNSTGEMWNLNGGQLNLRNITINNYVTNNIEMITHQASNISVMGSTVIGNASAPYGNNNNNFFYSTGGAMNASFIGNNYTEMHSPIFWLNKGANNLLDTVKIIGNYFYHDAQAVYGNTLANNTEFSNNIIVGDSNGYCTQQNDNNYNWQYNNNSCTNKTRGFYMFNGNNSYSRGNNCTAIWDLSHGCIIYDRMFNSYDYDTNCVGVNRACIMNSENGNTSSYNPRCNYDHTLNNATTGYTAECIEGSGGPYYWSGARGKALDYGFNLFPSSVIPTLPCENTTMINNSVVVEGQNFFKPAFVGIIQNLANTYSRGCGYTQLIDMNCSYAVLGNQSGPVSCFKLESTYFTYFLRGQSNNTQIEILINYQSNGTRIINHTFGSNFTVAQIYIQNASYVTVVNGFGLNVSNVTVVNDAATTSKVFIGKNITIQTLLLNGTAISLPVQWNYTDYNLADSNFNLRNFTTDVNGLGNTEMPSFIVNQSGIFNISITVNTTYYGYPEAMSFSLNSSNLIQFYMDVITPTVYSAYINSTSGNNLSSDNYTAYYSVNGTGPNFYNTTFWSAPNKAPILVMDFNVNNATNTTDLSGNNYNAGLYGNPTWNTTGGPDGSGAYVFNGLTGATIVQKNMINISYRNWTYCLWENEFGWNGSTQQILTIQAPIMVSSGFALRHTTSNTVQVVSTNGNGTSSFTTLNNVPFNIWQHYCISYNDTYMSAYKNGTLVTTQIIFTASNPYATTSNGIYIGNLSGGDRRFNGSIDNVKIWNRSLTASEIRQEYLTNGKVLDSSSVAQGETWTAYTVSSDGTSYSSIVQSNVTIASAPAIAQILYPINNSNYSSQGQTILVNSNSSTGNTLYFFYYLNGQLSYESSGNLTLSFSDGQWTLEVLASDNYTNATANSSIITFTIDSTAPIISGMNVTNLNTSYSQFNWFTNELANATIKYGTTSSLLNSTETSVKAINGQNMTAPIIAGTFYYYNVTACDHVGNCATSATQNFTSLATSSGTSTGGGGGASSGNTVSSDAIISQVSSTHCVGTLPFTLADGSIVCVPPCDGVYVVNPDNTVSCSACPSNSNLVNGRCVSNGVTSFGAWSNWIPKDRFLQWILATLVIVGLYLLLTHSTPKKKKRLNKDDTD